MKSLLDQSFHYATAEETRAPGYLRRRFAQIRKELREAKAREDEAAKKVLPIAPKRIVLP